MLQSKQIDADLDAVFSDWENTLTIAGSKYSGIYTKEYVETENISGYMPVFTGKQSELGNITAGSRVMVSSDIEGIVDKPFIVSEFIPSGRLKQLVLHEA